MVKVTVWTATYERPAYPKLVNEVETRTFTTQAEAIAFVKDSRKQHANTEYMVNGALWRKAGRFS